MANEHRIHAKGCGDNDDGAGPTYKNLDCFRDDVIINRFVRIQHEFGNAEDFRGFDDL